MSFRISIGDRWLEVQMFDRMFSGRIVLLSIDYGHNSSNNLIYLYKDRKRK